MADQNNTSSTQSPQDSFLSDPNAHHTKPIRPPRSKTSRSSQTSPSQPEKQKPMPLTAENLAKLSPKDENEAAVYKHTRIIEWIHRLPDPEDACNDPVYPYLDTQATESQPQHYADKLPTCPIPNISNAEKEPKARTHYHTPLSPCDMHIWRRFQKMRRQDVYAQFHRHGAWLTLQYAEDGKVAMFVGIDDEEHGLGIHRQMVWLSDKWLGVEVGLSYHIM